jgi:hypothetical protein
MNNIGTDAIADGSQALVQLQTLQGALAQLRVETLGAALFSELAQAQQELLAALPPRFFDVLMQLLSRLESSALFTDESCSFSRHDLLDSLQLWLDKAGQTFQAQASRQAADPPDRLS